MLKLALEDELIEKSGAHFSYKDQRLGHGKDDDGPVPAGQPDGPRRDRRRGPGEAEAEGGRCRGTRGRGRERRGGSRRGTRRDRRARSKPAKRKRAQGRRQRVSELDNMSDTEQSLSVVSSARPGITNMDVRMTAKRSLLLGAATNWAAFIATATRRLLPRPLSHPLASAMLATASGASSRPSSPTSPSSISASRRASSGSWPSIHATDDRTELNKLVSACLVLFTVAAACVLLIGGALVPFVAPGTRTEARRARRCRPLHAADAREPRAHAAAQCLPHDPRWSSTLRRQERGAAGLSRCRVSAASSTRWRRAPGLWSLAVVFTVTNLLEHAVMAVLAFRFLPGLRLSTPTRRSGHAPSR